MNVFHLSFREWGAFLYFKINHPTIGADCKCGYTEEKEVLRQFEGLIDKIKLSEIGVKERIKADVERFSKLQKFLLGTKEKINIPSIDIRGYAKYILKEGTNEEKRELMGCFRSKLKITKGIVMLD